MQQQYDITNSLDYFRHQRPGIQCWDFVSSFPDVQFLSLHNNSRRFRFYFWIYVFCTKSGALHPPTCTENQESSRGQVREIFLQALFFVLERTECGRNTLHFCWLFMAVYFVCSLWVFWLFSLSLESQIWKQISVWALLKIIQKTHFLDPQKTFPSDSHLQKALKPINQLYIEYKPLSFIVHHPPNIENTTQLVEFMQMVGRIESLPGGTSNSTQLWLRDYLDYDSKIRTNNNTGEYKPSYINAPQFLSDRLMEDKNIVFYHREG